MTRKAEPAEHFACDGTGCKAIAVTLPADWTTEPAETRGPLRVRDRHYCPSCADRRAGDS